MIKLPRTCHAGLHGPDVLAYSRIYRHVGIRHRDPTRNFGVHMVDNTITFQHHHGLRADGVVGAKTFEALRPHFDGYDRYLLGQEIKQLQVGPRDLIVGGALAMLRAAPFPYHEWRPIPWPVHELEREGSDCSGTSTNGCYKYAHLSFPSVPDPNGMGFDNYGSTYYMLQHGSRVNSPKPGDLCFYYAAFSHVGVYLGNGRTFSHGAPGDPHVIPSSWATQYRRYIHD